MKKLLSISVWCSILFLSCSFGRNIRGNNVIITETVDINDYQEIKIHGIAVVFVYEQSDDEPYFSITTDQNIYRLLSISTLNNTLCVRPAKDFIHLRPTKLVIHSNSRRLEEININGSGDFNIEGNLETSQLDININGSGKVVFKEALYADEFDIDINGNGDIYVAGKVGHADYDINGNGNIKAFKCETTTGDLDIAGNGKMEVFVQEQLNCEIAGNGSIFYKGDPRVNIEGAGKGRVRKVD